ncbi:MAG: hypothetical protein JNM99_02945 [Verrucomicrobiaceae bacterium]|nr:hypothetical protein [Verrucomicrobiaceae bacterium]
MSSQPNEPITSLRVLRGPNIWSTCTVFQIEVKASHFPIHDWHAADELLRSQKIEGTHASDFAAWLARAVIKIQREGRSPVDFHIVQEATTPEHALVIVEYEEELVGKAALDLALRWLTALTNGEPFDLAQEWEVFTDLAYDVRLGNSTRPAAHAARARGIPFYRLDNESLVQLGQGCRQRRIQRSTTDRTGFIANGIASDKSLTKKLIAEMGIPVPQGRAVTNTEDAAKTAIELGFPVVVKPQDGDYGNGVTMRILTEDGVRSAFAEARQWGETALVEHHVTGHLFRLLVIGGKLIAAVRREPWFVVGDGRSTLLELIEAANYDARRGSDYVSPFMLVQQQTGEWPQLTDDHRSHDSVPALDETVRLTDDIYLRNDGVHLDQTDLVHPDIVRMVVDATAIVGLDIAGLDVIATDLTLPPSEQEFAILEVNPEPGIILHMEPRCIPPRPIGEAIVDTLFASPEDARIPVTVVLGDAADFLIAQHMSAGRSNVGLASRNGAWLNGVPLGTPGASLHEHTTRLLRHPRTEALVVHVTLDDVLHEGLPFDRCDEIIEGAIQFEGPDAESRRRAREKVQSCRWCRTSNEISQS